MFAKIFTHKISLILYNWYDTLVMIWVLIAQDKSINRRSILSIVCGEINLHKPFFLKDINTSPFWRMFCFKQQIDFIRRSNIRGIKEILEKNKAESLPSKSVISISSSAARRLLFGCFFITELLRFNVFFLIITYSLYI